MVEGKASVLDIKNRAQVRTYHYPYTYTFYSVEHFLQAQNFDVRLSDIGQGRIIAHFDRDGPLVTGKRGYVDITLEAQGDVTLMRMVSSSYNMMNDTVIVGLREWLLNSMQTWLDEERTMILPEDAEDIPRFRNQYQDRLLMARPSKLEPADTIPLVKNMVTLGSLMMLSGILMVGVMGVWPLWTLGLVTLSGLPFMLMAMLILEDRVDIALSMYSSLGILAGLMYLVLTIFLGLIIILVPSMNIDMNIWEMRTWAQFYAEQEGEFTIIPDERSRPPTLGSLPRTMMPGNSI
jgi:hypothetical protein